MTDQGRKGDDAGRTGDTGDSGRSAPGPPGPSGAPGVSLTIEQLDAYVRRLERRYRRISRFLTIALVVTATAGLGSLAWTAANLRDRVEDQDAQRRQSFADQDALRREAVLGICKAINEQNVKIVRFRETVSPETAKLARETFSAINCPAEVRRGARRP